MHEPRRGLAKPAKLSALLHAVTKGRTACRVVVSRCQTEPLPPHSVTATAF